MQTNTNNPDDISLCPSCNCMTHTVKDRCAKCGADKFNWLDDIMEDLMVGHNFDHARKAIIARFQAQEQRHQVEVVRARIAELNSLDHNKQMFGDWQQVIEDRMVLLEAQLNTLTTTVDKERE
jgi:hypothetical protein